MLTKKTVKIYHTLYSTSHSTPNVAVFVVLDSNHKVFFYIDKLVTVNDRLWVRFPIEEMKYSIFSFSFW